MSTREALKQIRRLQVISSRLATSIFAGEYRSVFKGRGIEFSDLREYLPGDDVRNIDWNVTARSPSPWVRQFVEERELTVVIMLDVSPSLRFGTRRLLKSQTAAEIAGILAAAALRNNDKVGLLLYTDRVERFVPPRKGSRHLFGVIRELLCHEPEGSGSDLEGALEYLNRVLKRSAVVFLISDFYGAASSAPLLVTRSRHDLVAMSITDPAEVDLPDAGLIRIDDAETGQGRLVDSSDPATRRHYRDTGLRLRGERRRLFRSLGIDLVEVMPEQPYLRTLMGYFRARERRGRR